MKKKYLRNLKSILLKEIELPLIPRIILTNIIVVSIIIFSLLFTATLISTNQNFDDILNIKDELYDIHKEINKNTNQKSNDLDENELYDNDIENKVINPINIDNNKFTVSSNKNLFRTYLFKTSNNSERELIFESKGSIGDNLFLINLLGDKKDELILQTNTKGAHCCYEYHFFEIKEESTIFLTSIFVGDKELKFEDLDNDGIYEILYYDSLSYAYEFSSYVSSVFPLQIYKMSEKGIVNMSKSYKSRINIYMQSLQNELNKIINNYDSKENICKDDGYVRSYLGAIIAEYYYLNNINEAESFYKTICNDFNGNIYRYNSLSDVSIFNYENLIDIAKQSSELSLEEEYNYQKSLLNE